MFEVSLDAAGTMVDVDWTAAGRTVSISLPLATTPSVTFYGYGGDDTLVVDNSRGLVTLSDGIYFHGAAGFDVIRLVGDTAIDTSIYGVGPTVDAGRITHQTGESLQVVTFTGLEPVIDAVQAALLTVNATNADNAIAISDSLTPGFGRVTLDGFELVEFAAKAALQVNSLGGNDTIDVAPPLARSTIDAAPRPLRPRDRQWHGRRRRDRCHADRARIRRPCKSVLSVQSRSSTSNRWRSTASAEATG